MYIYKEFILLVEFITTAVLLLVKAVDRQRVGFVDPIIQNNTIIINIIVICTAVVGVIIISSSSYVSCVQRKKEKQTNRQC